MDWRSINFCSLSIALNMPRSKTFKSGLFAGWFLTRMSKPSRFPSSMIVAFPGGTWGLALSCWTMIGLLLSFGPSKYHEGHLSRMSGNTLSRKKTVTHRGSRCMAWFLAYLPDGFCCSALPPQCGRMGKSQSFHQIPRRYLDWYGDVQHKQETSPWWHVSYVWCVGQLGLLLGPSNRMPCPHKWRNVFRQYEPYRTAVLRFRYVRWAQTSWQKQVGPLCFYP